MIYRPRDRKDELSPEQQQRLAAGRHEAVARELRATGKAAAAGWVLEQIWDFEGALACYLEAQLGLDALRVALEVRDPAGLEKALEAALRGPAGERREAIAILERRGRHLEAARLMAASADPVEDQAEALRRGGDPLGAAELLAGHGRVAAALTSLGHLTEETGHASARGLAARLAWELGDAEATVRHAQVALRAGYDRLDRGLIQQLLGRALAALGHDLAAQIALADVDEGGAPLTIPGRYQVRRTLPPSICGSAYAGIDRVTLQEVEIHLLLADYQDAAVGPELHEALARFAQRAQAAVRLAHPAIRGIVRLDPEAGILVLPHPEGPELGSLIRPPGMASTPTRARALISYLVEGLAAAHAVGLCHGSILPSQIVCDAAGRPLLGPFGADELAGLAATRTGALEEVLTITAPERRAGAAATMASDIYSVGALFAALLSGELAGDLSRIGEAERALIAAATAERPEDRCDARSLLAALRVRAADARELHAEADELAGARTVDDRLGLAGGVVLTAADAWSDAELDALASADHPAIQPILDREGRRFVVAPWPLTCRPAAPGESPPHALPGLGGPLAVTIAARQAASTTPVWMRVPGGAWMLSLEALLRP